MHFNALLERPFFLQDNNHKFEQKKVFIFLAQKFIRTITQRTKNL